uniref:Uncharacterized protein n=1 Tax=Arundo donax TaxID=35708 RepID=A0A0A9HQZ6_ARUDO
MLNLSVQLHRVMKAKKPESSVNTSRWSNMTFSCQLIRNFCWNHPGMILDLVLHHMMPQPQLIQNHVKRIIWDWR